MYMCMAYTYVCPYIHTYPHICIKCFETEQGTELASCCAEPPEQLPVCCHQRCWASVHRDTRTMGRGGCASALWWEMGQWARRGVKNTHRRNDLW